MILSFAVDENWNVGYKNELLIKISEDLIRFKRLTINNIIVMGRKTFESLPGSKALPKRTNIVVTRDKDYNPPNTIVVHSLDELFETLKKINPEDKLETYMVGGGNLAEQLLPYCKQAFITKIYKNFEKADTSIPNLDKHPQWESQITSDVHQEDGVDYQYYGYTNKNSVDYLPKEK